MGLVLEVSWRVLFFRMKVSQQVWLLRTLPSSNKGPIKGSAAVGLDAMF